MIVKQRKGPKQSKGIKNPSLRPRQLAIITSYLRAAGHGLMAGDYNPVLPEDDALVGKNCLVDAWTELHPEDNGFTLGC